MACRPCDLAFLERISPRHILPLCKPVQRVNITGLQDSQQVQVVQNLQMYGARLMPMQVNTVEYQYQPTPFNGTTEKQESYKHWDLPERPARPPVPMRATLPFTGLSHIQMYTPGI